MSSHSESEHEAQATTTNYEEEIFKSDQSDHSEQSEGEEYVEKEEKEYREAKGKNKNGTRRSRKSGKNSDGEGEEVNEKILEARRDFDAALEKIKQGHRRRNTDFSDPIDLDEMASALRRKMLTAAESDGEAVMQGKPALAKHRMLPEVVEVLNQKHMHEVLLDVGILTAIRLWLEPLPNRSLPTPNLRKSLLELIRNMPVEVDHLRESRIGRIVMYFAQRPREQPDIQRLCKDLVSRWSRPIIGDIDHEHDSASSNRRDSSGGTMLQSASVKKMLNNSQESPNYGLGSAMSAQQKKLVNHMQKKGKSRKT